MDKEIKPLDEKIREDMILLCAFKNDFSEGILDRFIKVTERVENNTKSAFQNFLEEIKEGGMLRAYNLCIKTSRIIRERLMWKYRKEGWELAMEELNKSALKHLGEGLLK